MEVCYAADMKALAALLLWLALACFVWAQSTEPTRFEIYPLPYADVQAAEEAVRAVVGEEGSVVVDKPGRRVIVVTTEERHAQVAEMVSRLNVAPRNVRIDVEFRGASRENLQGFDLNAGGGVERKDGISSTSFKIKPRIQNETVSISSRVSQSLLVASGREGRIQVGESVPYLEWIEDWGLRGGVLQQRIQWQRVGSSLVVEPLVVGGEMVSRVEEQSANWAEVPYRFEAGTSNVAGAVGLAAKQSLMPILRNLQFTLPMRTSATASPRPPMTLCSSTVTTLPHFCAYFVTQAASMGLMV